ncbi:unnamed protein product [Rotaria magnacalcarata]|uniref:Uncharacterized protein n=3 Tax=Rotaria magnacalcarata TaxID=392030 RepID=A0A816ZVK3_9BILA|nr:unnamed protein product [Rotaria magnacalcarata]CAF3770711.1 unnamed protein product [Rotaria magnacalcarata]
MDQRAAKSYNTAYNTIDRLDSILFFYNYLCTWSIGIIFSLILPILYIFAPSGLRTTRTSNFIIICLVCLSNMFCIFAQVRMLSGEGEPNLPIHLCRFTVYMSTFAKPVGLYLTLLFSIERLFSKNLLGFFLHKNNYRLCFKRFYLSLILIGMSSIFLLRLYEVMNFVKNNQSVSNSNTIPQETRNNSSPRKPSFNFCFYLLSFETYAKILSFYSIQYWFEYVILSLISLILLCFVLNQYVLPRFHQRTPSRLSVNTKFYLCLSSCVISFELVLLCLHFIITKDGNNNSDTQVNALQTMLFVYNIRCIALPFIICLTTCDPLKEWIHELIILRPYQDKLDENDQTKAISERSETFFSSQ